jgi:chorismate dehydratase
MKDVNLLNSDDLPDSFEVSFCYLCAMHKKLLTVTAVEYLNTGLLVQGLRNSEIIQDNFRIVLDNPAGCTKRMLDGDADIGLVPVASIAKINPCFVFDNFCIGASGPVRTVKLLTNSPVSQLRNVIVDSHSRTSVKLLEVLFREYWAIDIQFHQGGGDFLNVPLPLDTGLLAIGDKVFSIEDKYSYSYDLAEEWKKMTGHSFVFALWLSKVDLDDWLIEAFHEALGQGLAEKETTINSWKLTGQYAGVDIDGYLKNNISYNFDESKKKGLEEFLELAGINVSELVYK